jgi:thiol:disulfide interchange protein DsbC
MKKVLSLVLGIVLFAPALSHGFSGKGQDCGKCHTLSKTEAESLLKEITNNLQFKIEAIEPAATKSFWEVVVDVGGKKGIVYVDYTKKYAILGRLIELKDRKDLTRDRLSEFNKVDVSKIPLRDAIVMGDKKAAKKVIVFSDPDCPFCAKLHEEMKKVVAERRDIAFYIKMNPLPMHKGAYEKAKAIVCAKSLTLLDEAFAKKPVPKASCETTAVDDSMKLAKALGISGAPAIVMPDGRLVSGATDAKSLIAIIDKK